MAGIFSAILAYVANTDLYVEMVLGQQNLLLYTTIVHVEQVYICNYLAFWSLTELALPR